MTRWQRFASLGLVLSALLATASPVLAEGNGQADLDEGLRVKIIADGSLRDLNKVIELLESALDKGLDLENSDFAEQVLSESLLERASQLGTVVESVPQDNLADPRMERIRDLAMSDLRRVRSYDNPPPQAAAMLAKLLALPGGDRDEARDLLAELVDDAEAFNLLPPDEQAATLVLRATLQDDAEKALADFARAVEIAPDKTPIQLARAEFQFNHDDAEAALADAAEVVAANPENLAALVLQAQIQRELKKYDDALASLAKAAELAPQSPIPAQYRGEIYLDMEEYDKAVDEFTRVLQMNPELDLALIRRSQAYLYAGKFAEALADVDAVLKDNPSLALAHGLRAQALAANNRLPDAIAEMKTLAGELPGQIDVHMQLALYYMMNEQPRDAIAEYSTVLELDAEHYLALRSRGDAYLNIGDHVPAIVDFERALALDPEDAALLNNFAWVLATSPDDAVRNGKRAIELATKACELTEYKQPHIISTLAAAFAESGDITTAKDWSRKGIAVNQTDLEAAIKADDKEQIEKLTDMGEALAKELTSYDAGHPIRERQTIEEAAPAESGPSEDAAANEETPAVNDAADSAPAPVATPEQ